MSTLFFLKQTVFGFFFPRLWDIECGACLRVLEGHEELVRCIRFDNKRIVSGAYDGYVFQSFFPRLLFCFVFVTVSMCKKVAL